MIKKLLNNIIFRFNNKSCKVSKGVIVYRKTKVGKNCKLSENCRLSKTVTLGDRVTIGENAVLRNISVGDGTVIESGVRIVGDGNGKIILGKECYIGLNNVLDSSDNISIGNFVHIAGPSTGLWCHSSAKMALHSVPVLDKNRKKFRPTAPVNIDNNVYIGGNCTIYPGITIGHQSMIGPNSAVTKSFPANSLIGGVPAIKIKEISIEIEN